MPAEAGIQSFVFLPFLKGEYRGISLSLSKRAHHCLFAELLVTSTGQPEKIYSPLHYKLDSGSSPE